VDTKASIVLAIETAVLGFIISLSSKGRPLSALQGDDLRIYRTGLFFVGLGILMALAAVIPQLGRRRAKQEWQKNLIYFGHPRHWDADKLAKALSEPTSRHRQMAEQLVQMSKIGWQKHHHAAGRFSMYRPSWRTFNWNGADPELQPRRQ
jgi:hypothetical protein